MQQRRQMCRWRRIDIDGSLGRRSFEAAERGGCTNHTAESVRRAHRRSVFSLMKSLLDGSKRKMFELPYALAGDTHFDTKRLECGAGRKRPCA